VRFLEQGLEPILELCLGEMERAREPRRAVASSAMGSPVLFQNLPDRPPVLRGRLHDHFLDVLRDQPLGWATPIRRRRPDLLAREALPVGLATPEGPTSTESRATIG
jgi:hypothetical protein